MQPNDARDESKLVALLTEIQLPLQLYVRSLLPNDSAIHDVMQHANAKIWEMRGDFEIGTNFKAWAFSIARFEVLNHRKRLARDSRLTFSEDLEEVMAKDLCTRRDDVRDRHEALRTCLNRLRPKDRALLLHRYSDQGTLAEFAKDVGRSVGGLKVTLHRLRNALLACVRRQLRDPEVST